MKGGVKIWLTEVVEDVVSVAPGEAVAGCIVEASGSKTGPSQGARVSGGSLCLTPLSGYPGRDPGRLKVVARVP